MQSDSDTAAALIQAARAAGADAADAVVHRISSIHIGVADGALEEAESAENREAGLRVLVGQRQACVSSSTLTPDDFAEMAARAVAMAREAPEDPNCGLADGDLGAADADLDLVDASHAPTPEQLETMARTAEAAALAVPGIGQVEQAHAGIDRVEIALAATNGFAGQYGRTGFSVGASAIAGAGLGRERDYAGETRRHFADLPDPADIGRLAGQRAAAALNPRKPPGGAVPVLYDARIARSLISHLLAAANGMAVARGASWLRERMDQQVLPTGMDVIENPLIPRGMSSRPFDAEGIPAAARPLIHNGVLSRWVLDSATGRKLGLPTTGNARRGVAGPPSPGVTNIVMTQGTQSREQLIEQMGTGLLVTSMIGSSINPTTGDYSRGASGFWIEGGEIAYPVNEITIAGRLPEMMQTLVAANDADPHRGYQVPSLLVQGLTVGA